MFLIGVMFAAALAWRGGGAEWIGSLEKDSGWLRVLILVIIMSLSYGPLSSLYPISFTGNAEGLAILADIDKPRVPRALQSEELIRVMGSLPTDEMTLSTLEMIRRNVAEAQTRGDVLFMDQRQLLTFGYIRDVKLVWEYEKKLMMDEALSGNEAYFEPFYRDLAAHRFSLIVSDPLRAPIKDSDYQFGEENNAWVKWVAIPVLCYYEPIETFKYVRVQLLVPSDPAMDCSSVLP